MVHGTLQPKPAVDAPRTAQLIEYERFIDQQVARTRTHVKLTELASSLMTMVAVLCGFLLVAAVLEHWLVPGGLGFWSRLALLLALATWEGYYLVRFLVPLLLKRINPVYAAQTIEASTPSLKNSLLNFLMFRRNPAGIRPAVYQVVEQEAATRLAGAPVESAVDRSPLIHVGYLLLALVVGCCLYKVLSPKDPLVTAMRVLLPWGDIQPPTRVRIADVQPGDMTVARGEQAEVSAMVGGLRDDEQVRLLYTTAGQETINRPIVMHVPAGQLRYRCRLAAEHAGIREELEYRIEAGDARSRTFHVHITPAPTLIVTRTDYAYPKYTGLANRSVQREGNIAAIEGTRVTIHAQANKMIKSARIDFDCDGSSEQRMKIDGVTATASFTLALNEDRTGAFHTSYQLRLIDQQGHANHQPVQYRIEVTPDLPPEVNLLAPARKTVDVPLDGAVTIETYALDPDFALRHVLLRVAAGDHTVWEKRLLDKPRQGKFFGKIRFRPQSHALKVGDIAEVWAVARDNKSPAANQRASQRKRLHITPPEHSPTQRGKGAGKQAGEDAQPANQTGDQNQSAPAGDDGAQGTNQPGDSPQQQGNKQSGSASGSGPAAQGDSAQGEAAPGQTGQGQAGQNAQQGNRAGKKGSAQPNRNRNEDAGGQQGQADQSGGGQSSGHSQTQNKSSPADTTNRSGGAGGGAGAPVANDGSDDGAVFRKVLERLQGQRSGSAGHDRQGQSGAAESGQPSQTQGSGTGSRGAGKQQPLAGGSENRSKGASQTARPPEKPHGDRQEPASDKHASTPPATGPPPTTTRDQTAGQTPGQETQHPARNPAKGSASAAHSSAGSQGNVGPDRPAAHDRAKQSGSRESSDAPKAPKQGDATAQGAADSSAREQHKPGEDATPARQQQPGGGKAPAESSDHGATPSGDRNQDSARPDDTAGRRAAGDKTQNDARHNAGDRPAAAAGAGAEKSGGGAPKPQTPIQPRGPKTPSADRQTPAGNHAAKSPAHGKTASDSRGAGAGDRPGGGRQGGGQQANRQGTGAAGQNQAADQGGGRAEQAGSGETSNQAGGKSQANHPTGSPGKTAAGPGSRRGSATAGNQPSTTGQPGQAAPSGGQAGPGHAGGSQPTDAAGGGHAGRSTPPPQPPAAEPGGDKPNLAYAKKTTDLVLKHLKDQLDRNQVDQDLLDQLGWTRKDLRRFVQRWQDLYRNARANSKQSEPARRELDETLRSLGMTRKRLFQQAGHADDRMGGLRELPQTSPPAEYQQQVKAYLKGTSRAE